MRKDLAITILSCVSLGSAIGFVDNAFATSYSVEAIIPADANGTIITDLTDDGEAIGFTVKCEARVKKACSQTAFIFRDSQLIPLAPVEGDSVSEAIGINPSRDLIVGFSQKNYKSEPYAVVWGDDGSVKILPKFLENDISVAIAVNDKDFAVGYAKSNQGSGNEVAVAWDLTEGIAYGLETPNNMDSAAFAINPEGLLIAGYMQKEKFPFRKEVAVFWNADRKLTELPNLGGWRSRVMAVNTHETMVGFSTLSKMRIEQHAALWKTDGSIQDLGKLDKDLHAAATSINDNDQIVGYSSGLFNSGMMAKLDGGIMQSKGFLYENGAMADLNALLREEDAGNWNIVAATKINNEGLIAAVAQKNDDSDNYWGVILRPQD